MSVTAIGNAAFKYAFSLKKVIYRGSQEQWEQIRIGRQNENISEIKLIFVK